MALTLTIALSYRILCEVSIDLRKFGDTAR